MNEEGGIRIKEEEIEVVYERLKKKKAAGKDRISNET